MTTTNLNDDELSEHLHELEADLLKDPTRSSPEALKKLLSPKFVEFGSSGRVFDLDSIIASLGNWKNTTVHTIRDFECLRLSDDTALVTYRIESITGEGEEIESLRSSLWIHEGDGWVVRFHQGTRKP